MRRGRRRPDRRKARQGGEVRFATILAKETKGGSQNQRVYTLELHEEKTLRSLLESWNEESEPASPIRSAEKILRAAEGKDKLSGDACAKEELLGDFTADVLADGKFLAQRAQADASRFRQLVRHVTERLKMVGDKIRGLGREQYVLGAETLRKHLREPGINSGCICTASRQKKASCVVEHREPLTKNRPGIPAHTLQEATPV